MGKGRVGIGLRTGKNAMSRTGGKGGMGKDSSLEKIKNKRRGVQRQRRD